MISVKSKIDFYSHDNDTAFFENIEFSLKEAEITVLFGASGNGKTTLLNILVGLYSGKFRGVVELTEGEGSMPPAEARKQGKIGLVTQKPSLFPWLNIEENFILPSKLNPYLTPPKKEAIEDALACVGLGAASITLYPHELSGGMQQRVAIARTLIYKPSFLFLDEVFTGLDPVSAQRISKCLSAYIKQAKAACLIISHDIEAVLSMGAIPYYLTSKGKVLGPLNGCNFDDIVAMLQSESNSN